MELTSIPQSTVQAAQHSVAKYLKSMSKEASLIDAVHSMLTRDDRFFEDEPHSMQNSIEQLLLLLTDPEISRKLLDQHSLNKNIPKHLLYLLAFFEDLKKPVPLAEVTQFSLKYWSSTYDEEDLKLIRIEHDGLLATSEFQKKFEKEANAA